MRFSTIREFTRQHLPWLTVLKMKLLNRSGQRYEIDKWYKKHKSTNDELTPEENYEFIKFLLKLRKEYTPRTKAAIYFNQRLEQTFHTNYFGIIENLHIELCNKLLCSPYRAEIYTIATAAKIRIDENNKLFSINPRCDWAIVSMLTTLKYNGSLNQLTFDALMDETLLSMISCNLFIYFNPDWWEMILYHPHPKSAYRAMLAYIQCKDIQNREYDLLYSPHMEKLTQFLELLRYCTTDMFNLIYQTLATDPIKAEKLVKAFKCFREIPPNMIDITAIAKSQDPENMAEVVRDLRLNHRFKRDKQGIYGKEGQMVLASQHPRETYQALHHSLIAGLSDDAFIADNIDQHTRPPATAQSLMVSTLFSTVSFAQNANKPESTVDFKP